MIPLDTIYLISQYNSNYKDSINISLLNKEINDNSNKIFLNNPLITNENYETISKYKFDNYELGKNLVIREYITKFDKQRNIYIYDDNNYLEKIPDNIEELVINLTEKIQINSIIRNIDKNEKTFPNKLTHLILGDYFNQSINLPNSLTHLKFGFSFNQPINLPNNLTHLTFGDYFNQPITLPNSLTHLTLGDRFNQPITASKYFHREIIPSKFKHLVVYPENQ